MNPYHASGTGGSMNGISEVSSWSPILKQEIPKGGMERSPSFKDLLGRFVGEVNRLQNDADRASQQLVAGETTDLHQVMIAVEKASLSLELTIEIRNKFIEAYRELMRMQV